MTLNLNKKTGQPYRVLWFGDLVALSGFGRIGNEVTLRLHQRGYSVRGVGMQYTGRPHDFPFHIWPTFGDLWSIVVNAVAEFKPDIIVSCQDFPYHHTLWHATRIDFSRIKWVWITPVDGTPVHPDWAKLADCADGGMVISRFGVEAMRQAGKRVSLCHPGINVSDFYPADPDEKKALREKAGYSSEDYIIGIVAMNQGRKAISQMIAAFHEFARDKPEAKLFLDMEPASAAGWDIPSLLAQMGWTEAEHKRVRYRHELFAASEDMLPLRNRYALMDFHMVVSHREGFGLPLLESMACRIPTMALDWCSGTEVVGGGRGYLVPRIDYMEHGCWGGARDAFPDMAAMIGSLNRAYVNREEAAAIARRGYEWAIKQTWNVTADQVEAEIQRALQRERSLEPNGRTDKQPASSAAPGLSDIYGPARNGAAVEAVGGHTGIQQPAENHPVPQEPVPDGGTGRDGGPS